MKRLVFLFFYLGHGLLFSQVTYHGSIAPIINKHCQNCHRNGDIGPMPLTNYEEVASYASMIKFVTNSKLMPPFKADHRGIKYANERSISDEDRDLISQWIDEGLVEGSLIRPKAKPKLPSKSEYDYTICMSESYDHYGIYYDQYQVFVLPVNLPEGKYIDDIIFEPGNKEIVRSANISVAPRGSSQKSDVWDPRYGFFTYGSLDFKTSFPNWYSWMPHTKGLKLEDKEFLYLPSDSELLLHIHYGPYGEIQTDSSCIHLNFADESKPILQNLPLVNSELLSDTFLIEGGLKKRISSSFVLPADVSLRTVTPLAHLLCRSWEVFAVFPDRTSLSLLSIDDWDFHWKEKYIFEQSPKLPKGTKIYATATYDNSKNNPYNPSDPPHTMKAGSHMYDENFICFFEFAATPSEHGYILKPFSVTDVKVDKVSFYINISGNYSLQVSDLSTGHSENISSNDYEKGNHTFASSQLPRKKGRYSIQLLSNNTLIDNWWFVIL